MDAAYDRVKADVVKRFLRWRPSSAVMFGAL